MLKTIVKRTKNIYNEENEIIRVENNTYVRKPNNEDELLESDVKVIDTIESINNDGTTNKVITCRNLINGVPDDENIVYHIENVINENEVIISSKKVERDRITLNEYDENGDLIRRHYNKKHNNYKSFSTFNYNDKKQLISQTRFCRLRTKERLNNKIYDYDLKGVRTKMNMFTYEAKNKNNFTLVKHLERSFKYNTDVDGIYELETIKSKDNKNSILIEIKNKKIGDLTFKRCGYTNGELQCIQILEYIKIKDKCLLKSIVTNSANGDFVRKVEHVYNDNGYVTEIVRTFIE